MEELFFELERRLTEPASQERVLRKLGTQVLDAWRDSLMTGGHGSFMPLAPSTVRAKMSGGYPLIPLIRTRAMLYSLTEGRGDNVFEVHGNEATVGTSDPKAGYHVTGGGRLPQRDFTTLSAHDMGLMSDTAAAWVRGEL